MYKGIKSINFIPKFHCFLVFWGNYMDCMYTKKNNEKLCQPTTITLAICSARIFIVETQVFFLWSNANFRCTGAFLFMFNVLEVTGRFWRGELT